VHLDKNRRCVVVVERVVVVINLHRRNLPFHDLLAECHFAVK